MDAGPKPTGHIHGVFWKRCLTLASLLTRTQVNPFSQRLNALMMTNLALPATVSQLPNSFFRLK